MDLPPYQDPIRWLPIINQESETCPPFGVMELKSTDSSTGLAKIGKPSADGTGTVLFNGPAAIPAGARGEGHQDFPNWAAYQADNDDAADPVHDETWGAKADSWYLHKDQPGFKIIGTAAYGLCNVQRSNWQDDLKLLPSYNASVVQFLYHDASGVLDWFDTEEC